MIRDVILPQTTLEDWERLRDEILQRVLGSLGSPPALPDAPAVAQEEQAPMGELPRRAVHFEAIPGFPTRGVLLLPNPERFEPPYPAVLCIHGTDYQLGHRNQISPDLKPHRAYATECAQRGYAALALDQTGFPAPPNANDTRKSERAFCKRYSDWSLDGARLHVQRIGLNLLAGLPEVDAQRVGCIGNSLGGRTALYLAALDPRIKAAIVSTGASPNLTNLHRHLPGEIELSPVLNAHHIRHGRPLWEYHELMALVAPRQLVMVEPWNDHCNPLVEPTVRCFERAKEVYRLLGADRSISLLLHGDGHGTQAEMRAFVYAMMDRVLGSGTCRS